MTKFKDLTRVEGGRCIDRNGKIWFICNGRPTVDRGPLGHEHIYICAKSKTDAARLLDMWWKKQHPESPGFGVSRWIYEIENYYAKGAWGNNMNEEVVGRGVWIQWERSYTRPPVKEVS